MRACVGLILFVSVGAAAANRVGNGGVTVACPDVKPQLLDFYEAGGKEFPKSVKGSDGKEIAAARLKLLERVAPSLASQYERRLKSMPGEWDLKEDVKLTATKDVLNASVPENCLLEQVVIRMGVPTVEADKGFTVDKKRFEQMSPVQQAGLYMHEIVYEHFSKLGETDSRKARKLVGLMFGDRFDTLSSGQFWVFIKELEIPLYP